MRRRSTLIGFTEAELGFVVAAVIAFTAAAEMPAKESRDNSIVSVTKDTSTKKPPVPKDSQSSSNTKTGTGVSTVSGTRPAWLSNVYRRGCAEVEGKKLSRVPVDVIDIEGIDQYRMGERTLSLAALNEILAPHEVVASENLCKYTLQFRLREGANGREMLQAEKPFRGRFYYEHVD